MIAPLILALGGVIGLGVALVVPGMQDWVMLAGPVVLASLWLLVRAQMRAAAALRAKQRRTLEFHRNARIADAADLPQRGLFRRVQPRATARAKPKNAAPKYVVIDGSNVMHWKDGVPQIEAVQAVIGKLTQAGYAPGVVFDANAGYKLVGKYRHDHALGKLLGLPADRVMVVDRGMPADPVILASAKALGARIVSNDRYRDWRETHPEVATPGHVISGGYRDGEFWLNMA